MFNNLKIIGGVGLSFALLHLVIASRFSELCVENRGISFGLGNEVTSFILQSVGLLAISVMIVYLFKRKENPYIATLVLILIGGISNFIDRIIDGYVCDYFYLSLGSEGNLLQSPIFNINDILIIVGLVSFTILSIKKSDGKTRNR